jgi:Xaa-Pro aminopeptidase
VRNRDVLHPFRQDSDFHYLTGFGEPVLPTGQRS